MKNTKQNISNVKFLLRLGWKLLLFLHVLLSAPISKFRGKAVVYYGGARSGNVGGPLVKLKRLQQFFPQNILRYNIVYLLSNAPYLTPGALKQLKKHNIPFVLNQNGVFYSGWYAGNWQKQNKIMSHAYHEAEYVFWQSNFCKRAADKFLGKREGKGEILYNAVDLNKFKPKKKFEKNETTFLLTGKIGKHLQYRLTSTVEGFGKACDQGLEGTLIIAGWIEDMADLRSIILKFCDPQRVKIFGVYSQEVAPQLYASADAYIMTKYLDPCPNTVIEAMACGLPILYSSSGGIPELVGEDAGVSLPVPEDWDEIHVPTAASIATGMKKIAEKKITMGKASRLRAEKHFDIQNWVKRHETVFNELLRNRL